MSAADTGALPRLRAARALCAVVDDGRSLADALAGLRDDLGRARDRALVRRLCNRVLRDLPALEWRLARLMRKPLPRKARAVHFVLLAALDQLIERREPAPAVVHASVAAVRRAGQAHLGGLVNAVLRNHQRRAAELAAALPDDPALRLGYPDWMLSEFRNDWPEDWRRIADAGNRAPPLWLRVNRRRQTPTGLLSRFRAAGVEAELDPRFPDAVRLLHGARVSALPGYEAGEFSVQDAGAQSAAGLLAVEAGQRVLDACAAPGGKAAHIAERADVDLTAVEIDRTRATRIDETFARLGLAGRTVTGDASRPEDWAGSERFDRILVDAPCSATGVLRRHPDIRWLRRPGDAARNRAQQRGLLEALWPRLTPGGLLVYATCSILHEENRDLIGEFVAEHADAEPLAVSLVDSVAAGPGRQILPGSLDRDGFFYARLRRLQ